MPPPPKAAARARRARSSSSRRPGEKLGVVVLSRNARLYSTRRLVEAAEALGHAPRVLDTLRCNMTLARDQPRMFHRGEELLAKDMHVAIPRIGASITGYGLAVVNQLDMMGVPVLNAAVPIARSRDKLRALQLLARFGIDIPRIGASITGYCLAVVNQLEMMGVPVLAHSTPIARSRDKLRALQLLARFGIDIPRTAMCRYREEVDAAVETVGGLPCIMKIIQGAQGVGVMIANTRAEMEGMLDTLWTLGQEILIQELVAESRGKDVRALVVGDRVVAAMRRTARAGDFRSNIHRGGVAEALALDREYAEAAVKAARVIGLEVAGVDMLEARTGPKIMEVNSSPGFEGLEKATGVDIATPYVEHAVEYARARQPAYRGRTA